MVVAGPYPPRMVGPALRVDPLLLAAAGGVGLAISAARRALTCPASSRSVYRPSDTDWVTAVRRELPRATRDLRLPGGTTQRPTSLSWDGPGERVPSGWRFHFATPGDVTISELSKRADNLAAAINTAGPLVAALEVDHGAAEGWGSVTVWRSDPLERTALVPWEPGARCRLAPPGTACWGIRRDGDHVHAPVVGDAGAVCSLYAGRRGSGKSVGMLGQVAQMVGWGWCRPVLVDVVRQGVDLAVFEPVGGPVATTIAQARAAIKAAADECAARLPEMRANAERCITRFTPDRPLIALVVDEVHAVMADKKAGELLTKFAQETRAMGGLVVCATQYPLAAVGEQFGTFRQQLAHRVAYRCSNSDESKVILGVTPDGQGPHELRAGPGACVADLDGGGLVTMRSWWLPDDWLSDHVAACTAAV